MTAEKSPYEMALRHVQEQRERMPNQEELIARLDRHNLSTDTAEDLLSQMRDLLRVMQADLARFSP
jgi:hypothetical protein